MAPPNASFTITFQDVADYSLHQVPFTLKRTRDGGGAIWVQAELPGSMVEERRDRPLQAFVQDWQALEVDFLRYLDSARFGPWQGVALYKVRLPPAGIMPDAFAPGHRDGNFVVDTDGTLTHVTASYAEPSRWISTRLADAKPREWFVVSREEVQKLTDALRSFRDYFTTGRAREDRESAEMRRLGPRELLLKTSTENWAELSYFWFPQSGSDTLYIIGTDIQGRQHARLSTVAAELADSQRRTGGTPQGMALRNAWHVAFTKRGENTFPMKVQAIWYDGATPYSTYQANIIVSVEKRLAGKLKGVPLLRFTASVEGLPRYKPFAYLFKGTRSGHPGTEPMEFGPFTPAQVQAGTSRAMPGRFELCRTPTKQLYSRGLPIHSGWHLEREDVQRILVALDQRIEQGLSGT